MTPYPPLAFVLCLAVTALVSAQAPADEKPYVNQFFKTAIKNTIAREFLKAANLWPHVEYAKEFAADEQRLSELRLKLTAPERHLALEELQKMRGALDKMIPQKDVEERYGAKEAKEISAENIKQEIARLGPGAGPLPPIAAALTEKQFVGTA